MASKTTMCVLDFLKMGRTRIAEDKTCGVDGSSGIALVEAAIPDVKERPPQLFSRIEREVMALLAKEANEFDLHHKEAINLQPRRLAIYDSLIIRIEATSTTSSVGNTGNGSLPPSR